MNKKRVSVLLIAALTTLASGCGFQQAVLGTKAEVEPTASIASMIALSDRLAFIKPQEDVDFTAGTWTQEEQDKIMRAVMRMENKLIDHGVHIERSVQLVKEVDLSEAEADEEEAYITVPDKAYVDQGWIVLPESLLNGNSELLYEELMERFFQLWLTDNPEMVEVLASKIGFKKSTDVALPPLATYHDNERDFTWILTIKRETYVTRWALVDLGQEGWRYMQMREKPDGTYEALPVTGGALTGAEKRSALNIKPLSEIEGVTALVGEMPEHAIWPQEILMHNFKLWVLDRTVQSSAGIRAIETALGSNE